MIAIDAFLASLPARHAAAWFGVGDATAIVWVRRAQRDGGVRGAQARVGGVALRVKIHQAREGVDDGQTTKGIF